MERGWRQGVPDSSVEDQVSAPCPVMIAFLNAGRVRHAPYRAGDTVLETARRASIPINTGCEKGDCGACIIEVIDGAVRMRRNAVLSADEIASGMALACQSLPDSDSLSVEIY
jgi:ferredoxin